MSYFNGSMNTNSRQLPSASTLPGYSTMPTSPVTSGYYFQQPKPTPVSGYPSPTTPTAPTGVTPAPAVPVLSNIGYLQAYLKTKIGRKARIEFLLGTNTLTDRDGIIEDVGISYITIRDPDTNDLVVADLYSIKFVTFPE